MSDLLTRINDVLAPLASGKLGHALIGLAILIGGLFVVKLLAGVFRRGLARAGFLDRRGPDGTTVSYVAPVVALVKAVLTIFVLMAVLQHFGLTDVLAPLKDMVAKVTGAVPNIIGAGVIAYAGWIIATIVSQLVAVALGKVDEQVAARTGNDQIKVSKFGSAFAFGGVLLPIVVAALGVLDVPAISVPASQMINKLMAAVPNVIGAGIILTVTYFVTKFVVFVVSGLLEGMSFDAVPERIGLAGVFSDSFTATRLIGGSIMFFSMMTAATAAVNTLGIDVISHIFARVLDFGGGILVGSLILIVGNFLGTLAYERLSQGGDSSLAGIARIAILGLVLAMGLRAMGLADHIVNMAFGFTIGGVAVAVALAFGFGGRDAAKRMTDSWASRVTKA